MIPLRDDIPSLRTPFVNWVLIALCLVAFAAQMMTPESSPGLEERYGFIPLRVSQPDAEILVPDVVAVDASGRPVEIIRRPAAPAGVPALATMLTCVFLHGGVMHILGNLWFLWIFGDNIEDRFGHIGYLAMYLTCGVAASFCHYLAAPMSSIPTIGASGAIAGVMGAYLVSYPHARVLTLLPLFIIFTTIVVPAPAFLVVWFGFQIFGGFRPSDPEAGGVAWWAHIGGFAVGAVMTYLLSTFGVLASVNRRRRVTRRGSW